MGRRYRLDELLKVAKRENNSQRSYLYVDPLQGKHIPVSPSESLGLFFEMSELLREKYGDEKLIIIGFAETATAIGSAIAYENENVIAYLNTTREDIAGADYLYFTESHSHAAEQRLAVNGLEKWLSKADRIIFAEDEVTTGNTICKLIDVLRERFSKYALSFGIVSILNSMTEQRLTELSESGIDCSFVGRIPFEYRINDIEKYDFEPLDKLADSFSCKLPDTVRIGGGWNPRIVCRTEDIRRKCRRFIDEAVEKCHVSDSAEDVLVLGTEETMFPAMLLGAELERLRPHLTVRNHASTRSPIEVSLDENYPLHHRHPLMSFYQDGRNIFVYDLRKYSKVIIVTDAQIPLENGVKSLVSELERCGNTDIRLVIWEENSR